jgi:putative redox protein
MARARASIGTINYATTIVTAHHTLTSDEGPALGGKDASPASYDLLVASLGACTTITLRMYAERKQWPVEAVHVDIHFVKDGDSQFIERVLHIEGKVDQDQKKRMAAIAEKTPVTLTLKRGLEIRTTLTQGKDDAVRI